MSAQFSHLTIIGNIGSGKSSAMEILAPKLQLPTVDADSLFQTTDPFAKPYLENTQRWAFTNELWLTVERSKLIGESSINHDCAIVDSGLLMSWVYGYSHFLAGTMTNQEWQFFDELFRRFAADYIESTAVVFLDYSVETILKNITKRGRSFELEFYTAEYLQGLQKSLQHVVALLERRQVPLLTITEKDIPEFVESDQGRVALVNRVEIFFETLKK